MNPCIEAGARAMQRSCMDCGATIQRCNGYVLARDVKALMEEGRQPRERCGKCVVRTELHPNEKAECYEY